MISVNLTTISFKIEYLNIIAYFLIMHSIRKQVLPTSEDIAKKLEVLIKE